MAGLSSLLNLVENPAPHFLADVAVLSSLLNLVENLDIPTFFGQDVLLDSGLNASLVLPLLFFAVQEQSVNRECETLTV